MGMFAPQTNPHVIDANGSYSLFEFPDTQCALAFNAFLPIRPRYSFFSRTGPNEEKQNKSEKKEDKMLLQPNWENTTI